MSNHFNPDDLKNPLYEHSQVVTVDDLKRIYQGLAAQYQLSRWWQVKRRYELAVAGHVVYELLAWLHDGKAALKGGGQTDESYN